MITRMGTDFRLIDTQQWFSFGCRVSQRKAIQIPQAPDMCADRELSRRKGNRDKAVKESRRAKRDDGRVTGGNEEDSPCKKKMKGIRTLNTEEEEKIKDK